MWPEPGNDSGRCHRASGSGLELIVTLRADRQLRIRLFAPSH
jgi:hypothetical protein